MNKQFSSRLPQFHKLTPSERLTKIGSLTHLNPDELQTLSRTNHFTIDQANNMVENVISIYSHPFGIATNFLINQKDYLIPMVIEEPSVIAAVSNAAKLFRTGGGFYTSSDPSIMIGQIQVLDIDNPKIAADLILKQKKRLLSKANEISSSIIKQGGGAKDIVVRQFADTPSGPMIVVHLLYDTKDAMGANAINTAVELLAPDIETLSKGRVGLRILSNLADQRKARAKGMIPASSLSHNNLKGDSVVKAIIEAGIFAEIDPYRATTHNKGIMNGIDAVVIATGNDWRAVESGAHAYAARGGSYTSLTKWWQDDDGNLHGSIELPLAVGIIGGATRVHPVAKLALRILSVNSAQELAEVIAAVGLAQNLAAIRALATEGIQHGHMRMHARQLAVAAGATGDLVNHVVQAMISDNNIRLEHAQELVRQSKES